MQCEHIGVLPRRGDSHCRATTVLLRCYGRGAAVGVQCCVLHGACTAQADNTPQRELAYKARLRGTRPHPSDIAKTLTLTLTLTRRGLTRRT